MESIDIDVRHFIYQTFSSEAKPPSPRLIADKLNLTISETQQSLDRLAHAHHIALAPGTHNIWMAHPFSSLRTDFTAKVNHKECWGN